MSDIPNNTIFERVKTFEIDEDNDVSIILVQPKPQNFISKMFHKGDKKVLLDSLGSFIWIRCDGKNTYKQILNQLETSFPDEEQLSKRASKFLDYLTLSRFIKAKTLLP
jgi:Coenzyme PQQ synthesis protein D (PqqD)